MSSGVLSDTVRIAQEVQRLRDLGHKIWDLGVGETLIPLHSSIKQAMLKLSTVDRFNYPPVAGLEATRIALVNYMKRRFSADITVDQCLVTCGGKHASYLASKTFLKPGDRAMICRPFWPSYPVQAILCSASTVMVESDDNFKISPQTLEAAYDVSCKLIYFNNAGNPSGSLYTESELLEILDWANRRNVLILSDEVYLAIDYDDKQSPSLAKLDTSLTHCVVVQSCSKSFAMTGLRVGFAVAQQSRIEQMIAIQSQTIGNTSTLAQLLGAEALNNYELIERSLTDEMKSRRDLFASLIDSELGLDLIKPSTALYYFLPVEIFSEKFSDSVALTDSLLNQAKVCVVPGIAFGQNDHIRLSFGAYPEVIENAVLAIGHWKKLNA